VALPTERDSLYDPPLELGLFRAEQPVRRLQYADGHVGWLVTSDELARAVLTDSRITRRPEALHPQLERPAFEAVFAHGQPGVFVFVDPPEHTRYRRILAGHFNKRTLAELTSGLERRVADHLDAIERSGPPADLVEQFAFPIPSLTICELLGVPFEYHEEWHRHHHAVNSLDSTAEEGLAAWKALDEFMQALIRRKRAAPESDLLSVLAAESDLTDAELSGVGLLLHDAGHETTSSMLALGTMTLLTHPDQLDLLRANPEMIDGAVEELMRYLTIAQFGLASTATEDMELGGEVVRAGETVTVSVAAANRDPSRYEDPDRLDLGRDPQSHLGFGRGMHACLGQQLARMEMRIGFPALLERFPGLRLAVPPEEIPMRHRTDFYGVDRLPIEW
jgi:cytochrome P450